MEVNFRLNLVSSWPRWITTASEVENELSSSALALLSFKILATTTSAPSAFLSAGPSNEKLSWGKASAPPLPSFLPAHTHPFLYLWCFNQVRTMVKNPDLSPTFRFPDTPCYERDCKVAQTLTPQKDESRPERLKFLDFVFELLLSHFDQNTL